MASFSEQQRGFMPAQNEQERLVMRRAEDLYRIAHTRGFAQYSTFLSDREQTLAKAAINKAGGQECSFEGGYPDAERKLLCIQPAGAYGEPPISCVRLQCAVMNESSQPAHKDYLGSLLGLGLERKCLGDIILDPENAGTAYVLALERIAELICTQLINIGRFSVRAEQYNGSLPAIAQQYQLRTATVSSLRADAVLAAMLQCSRGQAANILRLGGLEINHIATTSPHAPVYEGDIFTVRKKGRYKLQTLGGKSKKERLFIEFFQY